MKSAYKAFSLQERFVLALKAQQRDDDDEYRRLLDSTPRYTYSAPDVRLTDRLQRVREAAWNFLRDWNMIGWGRELGVTEAFDAAARILDSKQLGLLANTVRQVRKDVRKSIELVERTELDRDEEQVESAQDDDFDQTMPLPEACFVASGPNKRLSSYVEFTRYRCSIFAGFQRFAECAGISVDEALAPLPGAISEKLLLEVTALPGLPCDEATAQGYCDYLTDRIFVEDEGRTESDIFSAEYNRAVRVIVLSLGSDDSD